MKLRLDRYTLMLAVIFAIAGGLVMGAASGQSSITNTASCSSPPLELIVETYCTDLPIMLIAVMIAFLIAALIFMLGAALKNDRLRNFGIGELYEAIASAIIVALFLYIAWVVIAVIPNFIAGTTDPISYTLNAINNVENQAIYVYSTDAYGPFYTQSTLIGNEFQWSTPAGQYSIPIFDYAKLVLWFTYVLPLQTIAQFLVDGIYALWVEYYFIQFFVIAAVPAFIAPGVVFRAFFPTRGLGGAMIAVGIGFFIVMPTLFAFAYSTVSGLPAQLLPSTLSNLPGGSSSLIGSYLAPFWLMILFYPALIIALTYAFITQLTNFIGTSTSMGGRVRALI